MSYQVPVYKASSQCAKCKGACCKHMGCHFSPKDFEEITYEHLKSKIDEGWISIDWWEADENEYFLRVRHVGAEVVDPSWGGVCMLLTDKGCSLPFEKRPLGAKALEPKHSPHGYCIGHYSKEQCKNDWKPYDHILKRLVFEYEFEK